MQEATKISAILMRSQRHHTSTTPSDRQRTKLHIPQTQHRVVEHSLGDILHRKLACSPGTGRPSLLPATCTVTGSESQLGRRPVSTRLRYLPYYGSGGGVYMDDSMVSAQGPLLFNSILLANSSHHIASTSDDVPAMDRLRRCISPYP